MRRGRVHRSLVLAAAATAAALTATGACGGVVVVDGSGGHGEAGAAPDAGPPSMDASADASKPDAASGCDDPTVCSRVVDHEDECVGAAKIGDFCDFLGTPCSASPPDCDKISGILGAPAKVASCGNGQSFCDVDWTGTLSAETLDALCAAHAASGQPIDCLLD